MITRFKIEAVFEGRIDSKDGTFELLKTDERFKDLPIEEAVGKLLRIEIERNRETFGTYLQGLPEIKSVTLSDD